MRATRKLLLPVFALCVLGIALSVSTASGAQIAYGVDRASNLYVIDYVNGTTTLIGALGIARTSAFTINQTTGDAFASPGGGYGNNQLTTGCLYDVDLASGAATQIGCDPNAEGLDPFSDFAFHSNGTLYALRLSFYSAPQDSALHLCTVDLATGVITEIESLGSWGEGNSLAFVGDSLYTWETHTGLSTLDLTDATLTTIGFGRFIGFPSGLLYPKIPAMAARQDGTLYGIVAAGIVTSPNGATDYYLAIIDRATGDVTYVATLPQGMQNIAFSGTVADGCPGDPDKTEPGLCGCGVAETDSDSDGTVDCVDLCDEDPLKTTPDVCGCGVPDTDTDSDSTADCNDGCPFDPAKTAPAVCGCGVADSDSDGDGTADCIDGCPDDPAKTAPEVCGCGVGDTDTDSDGTLDCNDACPLDPAKTTPGVCGCGVADVDSDGDAVWNCIDNCPSLANADQTDANSNGVGDACDTLPDLSVSWSSLRFNANNMSFSGRAKVMNTGTANAGPLTVKYYLSTNGTDLGELIGTDTITGVRIGRAVGSSVKYQASSSPSGQYVIAVVDPDSEVIETKEGNNRSAELIP